MLLTLDIFTVKESSLNFVANTKRIQANHRFSGNFRKGARKVNQFLIQLNSFNIRSKIWRQSACKIGTKNLSLHQLYEIFYAIWYIMYNLKYVENTHEGVLLSLQLY